MTRPQRDFIHVTVEYATVTQILRRTELYLSGRHRDGSEDRVIGAVFSCHFLPKQDRGLG
jgi:hypothetical protein